MQPTPLARLRFAGAVFALATAACGGDAAVDPVDVRNFNLVVEPAKLFLGEGQDGRLYAKLVDDAGNTVPASDLIWTSSDPAIASVDATGGVLGIETGTVTVTASSNGKKRDADVKVRGKGRLEIHLGAGTGQTGPVADMLPQPLLVEVRDRTGEGVAGIDVDWSVQDGSGFTSAPSTTTNQNGRTQVLWTLGTLAQPQSLQAQVNGAGTVQFTASATPGDPTTILLSPGAAELEVGQKQKFSASAKDRFGNTVEETSVLWTTTAGDVVYVDTTGTATAMSPGSAAVEAYVGPAHGAGSVEVLGQTGPATVPDLTVGEATSSSITLSFTEVDDGSGNPASYEIRAGPSSGYSWSAATPVSTGTCATPLAGDVVGQEKTCTVEGLQPSTSYTFQVAAFSGTYGIDPEFGEPSNAATGMTAGSSSEVAYIETSHESYPFTALGQSVQLSAQAYDATGEPLDALTYEWTSSDPAVASVDGTGFVTARAVGATSIVVAALSASATVDVTITQVPAAIEVSPAEFTLEVGQTKQLTASVLDQNGHVIEGESIVWSSTAPSVASIDTAGLVMALSEGSAQVEAAHLPSTSSSPTLSSLSSTASNGLSGPATDDAYESAVASSSGDLVGVSKATVGGSGSIEGWPNEPSSFTLLSDRSITSLDEGGWNDCCDRISFQSDAAAPASPPGVLQFFYPEGQGGVGKTVPGGVTSFGLPAATKEIYFGFWMKLSNPWQEHSTNDSPKLAFVVDDQTGGGGDPLVIHRRKDGTIGAYIQNAGNPPNRSDFAPLTKVIASPGAWARVETIMVMNSEKTTINDGPSPGQGFADGELHLWVNGTKVYEITDIWYSDATDPDWDVVRFQPLWGGQGDVLLQDNYLWLDHLRLRGRQ